MRVTTTIIAGVVTISACEWLWAAGDRTLAEQHLSRAMHDFQAGKYAAAYESASASARELPVHSMEATLLLAKICHRSGRLRDALQHAKSYFHAVDKPQLRDLPSTKSSRQDVAVMIGDIECDLGRIGDALPWYRLALKIPSGKRENLTWSLEVQLKLATVQLPVGQSELPQLSQQALWSQAEQALEQLEQGKLSVGRRALSARSLVKVIAALSTIPADPQTLQRLLDLTPNRYEQVSMLIDLADAADAGADVTRQEVLLTLAIECYRQIEDSQPTIESARLLSRLSAALDELVAHRAKNAQSLREQANKFRTQAARWLEELCRKPSGQKDPVDRIWVEQQHLQVARRASDWPTARAAAEELVRLRRRWLLADDPAIYHAVAELGTLAAKCHDFAEARRCLQEALEFWQRHEPCSTNDISSVLKNLAEVAREQGEYDYARRYFEQAIELLNGRADGLLSRLEAYTGLAEILSAQGRYDSAVRQFSEVENITRATPGGLDDSLQRVLSRALLGRAIVYRMHVAQLQLAIDDCERALELERSTANVDPLNEIPILAARATLYLARYEAQGLQRHDADLKLARESIERAYRLASDTSSVDRTEQNQVLHTLAVIRLRDAEAALREHGERAAPVATTLWQEATTLWRRLAQTGSTANQARSCCYLAEAHLLAFDRAMSVPGASQPALLDQAWSYASRAIRLLDQMNVYPALQYRALLVRAKILRRQAKQLRVAGQSHEATAKIDLAIADLESATRQIEAPRLASLGSDPERAEFFSQFVEAYELLVSCLAQQRRYEEALAYSQISRNRTFIEQVLLSESDLRAELELHGKGALLAKLAVSAQRRDELKGQCLRMLDAAMVAPDLDRLRKELAAAQRQCDDVSAQVRLASRSYHNLLEGGLNPADWAHARRQVLKHEELLLVYHLGESGSYLFVVSPDSTEPVEAHALWLHDDTAQAFASLGIEPGPLTSRSARKLIQIYLWRRRMRSVRGREEQPVNQSPLTMSTQQSLAFSELILPQAIRERIVRQQNSVLIVVPDGPINELPLESLPLLDGRVGYMLDDKRIPPVAYVPSVMVLAALEGRSTPLAATPELLTVGNPRYQGPPLLPASVLECEEWRRRFAREDGQNVQTLLWDQATRANVARNVRNKHLLHFAVHGEVNPRFDDVFASSLLLTPATSGDADRLNLHDVYLLPLQDCQLAVLSACNSNMGAARKLEAGATLTRAFLSAGARRVVSSLWPVDDEATRELMGAFAEEINASLQCGASPNYAQALQQARRHVKQARGGRWADPEFWAPFVLVGPAQ